MSLEDALKLQVDDKVDHRDPVGRFVYAVVSAKQGTNLKIHYVGWAKKWDKWSDFNRLIDLLKLIDIKRPAHRFKNLKKEIILISIQFIVILDGNVEKLEDWIRNQDKFRWFMNGDKNYLYWAHLDNEEEIVELTTNQN